MWPSGSGDIKEGLPGRNGGPVVSGTDVTQECPSPLEEGEEEQTEEELDGDELGLSFPSSNHSRIITRNKNLYRTPRLTSTKPQTTVEEALPGGESKQKGTGGWVERGSEEESGSGEEEGVEGYCMNGRDSGIHLDDEGRFDYDASNPDLRSNRSSSSRLAQSTSDLSLYHSGSDVQLNQSSPDLLNPGKNISIFESLPSMSGGSDGALNRPVLRDAQRHHSEYFSEEEEDRERIDRESGENQNETEQYAKEQENHFEEDLEEPREIMKEGHQGEGQDKEENEEIEQEERNEEEKSEVEEQGEETEEEEDEDVETEEEEEEEEEEYDDYSNHSSFQDTSLSPAGLGGQIYKSCTFFDLSLGDDATFTPSPKSTFHREAPLFTRSHEQLNLEEHFRGVGYQAEEQLPWPDLFPRSERQSFSPDSYLDESELLGAEHEEQPNEEALSVSYERDSTRPRDFWADDSDEDELGESDGEDEVLRYLDDELLALRGQSQREQEEMAAAANWYNYYFVQSKRGNLSWVTNFSPCPGLRPISEYRFFQPGYLEVITEDDETVSALSEKADESTRSSSGSGQHAHKTMDTAQTTFSEQKEKARENGVQREDSGIVMEPDYKEQNDVIIYNSKKVVTNGCDVSTGDEDEGSGSHGNMVELVNGDNKESESDLNDSASERHDTTDTQSDTENDSDALLNMGHEQKSSNKPKTQTTTVILTTKEYLANGHCRTIIETTRTVRDENGKESASKEIRIETTEPPMPQLKEEDENAETVPQDSLPATTTPTTTNTHPTATHTEPELQDEEDRSDIPKVSLTAATPRQSIDDDSPQECSSPRADTQPEVITPVEATSVSAAPTAGDDKQISPPPVQTNPPEPCPEPEIIKPEVVIRSSLQEAEVVQSVPADAQNEAKTTTETKEEQVEVVDEVVLSQTRADAPVEATPPTIAAEKPAEVQEELVVAKQIIRVRGVAPRKPERTPSVREPVVVVTDPTTEKAVLQNNNSLLPCGDKEYVDANVIADLVYRRFRPNVAKRKLIVLLFPPPYQELGDPIEEPEITPVRVKKETALPSLFDEDVVKADPEEKDEELRNATGEASPGVDDDEQKGRKRNPGFFRRVVRALRRTFNRG